MIKAVKSCEPDLVNPVIYYMIHDSIRPAGSSGRSWKGASLPATTQVWVLLVNMNGLCYSSFETIAFLEEDLHIHLTDVVFSKSHVDADWGGVAVVFFEIGH